MEPIIDHIEITVQDMNVAEPFYDKLMPLLGFDLTSKSTAVFEEREFYVVEYAHPKLGFAINSPRPSLAHEKIHRRRPGTVHHIAFRAESREEVDRLHDELVAIGAHIMIPPRVFPEYVPAGYYAMFFKDPEGLKYEIVNLPPGSHH